MPSYEAMYKKLFNSITDAITALQQTQKETEEMYVSAPEPDIRLLPIDTSVDDPKDK